MKKKDLEILKEVISALLDKSQKVKIETLRKTSESKHPRIPKKNYVTGYISKNHMDADSVTLGSGIAIRRIWNEPIKNAKGHEIDTGWHWIVRTPNGEASFVQYDNDLSALWGAALNKADKIWGDHTEEEITNVLSSNIKSKELLDVIKKGPTKTVKKNKYEQALLNLKALGVTPQKLVEYVAKKTQNISK